MYAVQINNIRKPITHNIHVYKQVPADTAYSTQCLEGKFGKLKHKPGKAGSS